MRKLIIIGKGRLGSALRIKNPDSKLISFSQFSAQTIYPGELYVVTSSYTKVDKAEIEPGECLKYNILVAKQLVQKAKYSKNTEFIYISTFGAFPQEQNGQYYAPQSQYHVSKFIAESIITSSLCNNIYILRIGWLIGVEGGFEQKIYEEWSQNNTLKVNVIQNGQATHVNDISFVITMMGTTIKQHLINIVSTPIISRHSLALAILRNKGVNINELSKIQTENSSHKERLATVPIDELASTNYYTYGYTIEQMGDACPYLQNLL